MRIKEFTNKTVKALEKKGFTVYTNKHKHFEPLEDNEMGVQAEDGSVFTIRIQKVM